MAPSRKKSVNKQFLNEVSPEKEVKYSQKNKERRNGKGKLSKLGPQWSKGELQRFYRAYREYGKDWKKVAAEVRNNRSAEMAEALYHMNQAYLSLPDGTASVLGLIAMMTDHYNCAEGSDSEEGEEDNCAQEFSRKSLKRKRGKIQFSSSIEEKTSHFGGSIDGCLSLLKKARLDGGFPRAVGKRTPRVPVNRDGGENYFSPKKSHKSEIDSCDDEGMHVAALALAHASQKRGSPQACQTPNKTSPHIKSSAVRSSDMMFYDASVREDWSEGGVGSKKPGPSSQYRYTKSMMEIEGTGAAKVHRKGKKLRGNKVKIEEIENGYSDDGKCSGAEAEKVVSLKREVGGEVSNAKNDEVEVFGLDPLQTLAHISLLESESCIQFSEKTTQDVDDRSTEPEAYAKPKGPNEVLREREKSNCSAIRGEDASLRKSKLGTPKLISEAKQRSKSINNNSAKRKTEPAASKALNGEEGFEGSQRSRDIINEEDENASVVKSKRTSQISTPSKQSKSIRSPVSAFKAGTKHAANDVSEPTAQVPVANQVIMETRKVNRRKLSLKKALKSKEQFCSGNLQSDTAKSSISLHKEPARSNENLSSCLSSPMVRRWCMFEWFYSAIDYPWFAKREFVEYLTHVGLGNIPRLTRVEWGVIRSSLGKPRRFSDRFLLEEREKLEQYRESVRKHYSELLTGLREGLPTDLARPLTVGQRVIAVDPKTRELFDGSVLTVDRDRCRVQFDCPDIGVEFVKDIDCMPLNAFDNMPEALRRQRLPVISNEPVNGQLDSGGFTSNWHLENVRHPLNLSKQSHMDAITCIPKPEATTVDAVKSHLLTGTQPSAASQNKAKDAMVQAYSEIKPAFNKGANSAVTSVEQQLKTRSVFTLPPWLKPLPNHPNFNSSANIPSRDYIYASQESRSNVNEIIFGSRLEAQTMVDTAVQTVLTVGEGDCASDRIKEALASIDTRQVAAKYKMNAARITAHASTVEPPNGRASEALSFDKTEKTEAAIPSELLTSCLSAIIMIQKCAERQHPPGDVAQIIDSAVTSVYPGCPRNLPIYREIQTYMGRIKTQLLALVPTRTLV